jgi:hypothetical protein
MPKNEGCPFFTVAVQLGSENGHFRTFFLLPAPFGDGKVYISDTFLLSNYVIFSLFILTGGTVTFRFSRAIGSQRFALGRLVGSSV